VFRPTDIVLIAVMVSGAAFTYQTKHDAEDELRAVRKLEAQIRFEEETIDLLKADWSLLTQPVRLQRLTEAFQAELNLQPVDARQIVDPSEIPLRPPVPEETVEPAEGMAAAGTTKDAITTGSTPQ
jgi:hypothetical protein